MHVKGATRESAVIRRMLVAEIWIPELLEFALDAPVTPGRVLLGQPPDEKLGLQRDRPFGVDPMRSVPLASHQFAMPPTQGIGSEEVGEAFSGRPEVLEDCEYKSLFASRFWVGDLAPEDGKLLAQDQEFEILRTRGWTSM